MVDVRAVAMAAVLFLVSGWAAAAAPAPTPLWTSDEVRQARRLADEDALIFDVHTEATVPGRPPEARDITVTLAPTFTLVEQGGLRQLEDHTLCRSLSWKAGAPSFESSSCYAAVAFRVLELQNRQMLAKVLSGSGAGTEGDLVYLAEAELGVPVPNSPSLTTVKTAGAVEYLLGRTRVARVSGSAGKISPDEARRVRRFIARTINLHPQVRNGALSAGELPASIESAAGVTKTGEGRRILRISNLRRGSVPYPLPSGLASALAAQAQAGASPRDQAVQRAASVIAGKASPPEAGALRAELGKAVAERRALAGLMLLLQISQDRPGAVAPGDPLVAKLQELMASSPEATQFVEANRLAGDSRAKGDREAAARFLVSDQMKAAPFATFRNVTYANLLAGSGDVKSWDPKIAAAMPSDPVDNYWLHVAAHPWSSHAYKDAGDTYLRGYDMDQAWIAFDLGRAVDPDWRKGPMPAVAEFEEALRTGEPDFF